MNTHDHHFSSRMKVAVVTGATGLMGPEFYRYIPEKLRDTQDSDRDCGRKRS